jgi:preprotein translocase subunit SecA
VPLLAGVLPRWPQLPGYRRSAARLAVAAQSASGEWAALPATVFDARLAQLRRGLRRQPWNAALAATVIGAAAGAVQRTLSVRLYDTQLLAALLLLDGRLAEMATGEGKTLAAALAAAVQALAGTPLHLVTANDYLVQRDCSELGPYYAALGLTARPIIPGMSSDERRAAYAADVTYCTARELAFDYLRDGLLLADRQGDVRRRAAAVLAEHEPADSPVMRGLCAAILDEADSILIDEATVPLVIAQAAGHSDRRAFLWQALALARQLSPDTDFRLVPATDAAELLPAGRERVAAQTAALAGPWQRRRHAQEAVETALHALHGMHRDHDYLVREQAICPLDKVTGRAAGGRVWSRGLQTFLEIKEQCPLSAETETVARTSYPSFFQRYLQLSGMSGTLSEAARELRHLYALRVVRVPLRQPLRRTGPGIRIFSDDEARWTAVAGRVREITSLGRPVLIGTDSIEDSESLATRLRADGTVCAVLHARQDRDEASIIARAGEAGRVTVATRMAGRGTDIRLAAGVAEAGGLHVINCQHNHSRRLDRQLAGRCARQGDPGSVELCYRCDLLRGLLPAAWANLTSRFGNLTGSAGEWRAPAWFMSLMAALPRWLEEASQARLRRQLLEAEQQWAQQLDGSAGRY